MENTSFWVRVNKKAGQEEALVRPCGVGTFGAAQANRDMDSLLTFSSISPVSCPAPLASMSSQPGSVVLDAKTG